MLNPIGKIVILALLNSIRTVYGQTDNFSHPHIRSSPFVYKSYQTSVSCSPSSAVQYPRNALEVQQIVQSAIAQGKKVKALGGLHSITDIICTDGVPISMRNIKQMKINDEDGATTVTVGAGAELHTLLDFLQKRKKSLIHLPSYGGITVGGTLGTGAHGSTLLHPSALSDQVVSLRIVDGTGQMRIIQDPEELKGFRVHLGLLGIITEVTLRIVPLFKMTMHHYLQPDSILLDGTALNLAHNHDYISFPWFPSSQHVVVMQGDYIQDINTPGESFINNLFDSTREQISAFRSHLEMLQSTKNLTGLFNQERELESSLLENKPGTPPFYANGYDNSNFKNRATGYAWQMMSGKCNSICFWANGHNDSVYEENAAFTIDISELPAAIRTIKNILYESPTFFLNFGIWIRLYRKSDAFMSATGGKDSADIEFVSTMRKNRYSAPRFGLAAYQAISQALLKQHGGRPHWGKNAPYFHNREVIKSTTPKRHSFISLMKKYDPNGSFLNKFGLRLLDISSEMEIDPKVTHCALQEYCVCSTYADCADGQECSTLNGYPVCKDIYPYASSFPPTGSGLIPPGSHHATSVHFFHNNFLAPLNYLPFTAPFYNDHYKRLQSYLAKERRLF